MTKIQFIFCTLFSSFSLIAAGQLAPANWQQILITYAIVRAQVPTPIAQHLPKQPSKENKRWYKKQRFSNYSKQQWNKKNNRINLPGKQK